YPLKIRKWKIGDYFYPLGMKGRKKIAKFFKDEKYNTVAKEAQWLLCSGDKVVWIIGKRADERFKVSATSTEIVKITVI
ncbi:MAG: tRNA lysidine(34) synthetase TilS, partial [Bacteroidota bacterium]